MSFDNTEKLVKKLTVNKDKKLGLVVNERNKKVVVTAVDPGSVAAEHLKLNDCIIAVNAEQVKDKERCEKLIDSAVKDHKDVEIAIERCDEKPTELSLLPEAITGKSTTEPAQKTSESPAEKPVGKPVSEKPKEEVMEIPEFDFLSKDKPGSEKSKTGEKVTVSVGETISMTDEEMGNPLDGLTFPAPADVRAILRKRIPEILADYLSIESPQQASRISLTASASEISFEREPHEQAIASDVPPSKILKLLGKKKKKKKKQ